jgi:hypothetical protein
MNFDSKPFEQAPVGNHFAKLFSIVDIGTQTGEYQGKPTKNRQSMFTWELVNETREDGKRHTITKYYTQSLGEKANLGKDLTSWLGKAPKQPTNKAQSQEFVEKTLKPLLGQGCQIVISEKEDTGKRGVSAVIGLPKGQVLPDGLENDIVFFDLDNYDENVFDGLSEYMQKKIMASPEYAAVISGETATSANSADEEEIPF